MAAKILKSAVVIILSILVLAPWAAPAQEATTTYAPTADTWGNTYTPDEIEAIEKALWAANLTLEDLNFRKDYTEGTDCFPVVRDMLAEPMIIASEMDRMLELNEEIAEGLPSPASEVQMAYSFYPEPYDETDIFAIHEWKNSVPWISHENFGNPEDLVLFFETILDLSSQDLPVDLTGEEHDILRNYISSTLSWHDIFDSPYSEEQREEWDTFLEDQPDAYIYELMSKVGMQALIARDSGMDFRPELWVPNIPDDFWPRIRPIIVETEHGTIAIGTLRDDTWEGEYAVLIEPGGDDTYNNCRIGASYGTRGNSYGYFIDLEGDDFYNCPDTDITIGAAILGTAAFYDIGQGNDRYYTGSCALGAAMCGIATFYDDGGSDIYRSKVYSQGAAGYGIGVMVDASVQAPPETSTDEGTPDPVDIAQFDNDSYYAWTNSQAFARTLGFAICSNERGNDTYEAGGVYLHAPLFADRYQSFSQGFAIGERGIDYAGGIALIVDYDGNDRYLGDIYNQGVGYWYSAGLLYDVAGNDSYEMTQYGQGSGIHLAVGGLIDGAGSDCYVMHMGLGTGGSHDYAASVLHDRGGNDQYFGNTSCNGGSLTNSAVIFIDRSGDDTYAGRRSNGINFGRPARGFTSIGVLVDLGGNDDYLGIMDNGMLWTQDQVGVGWDIIPPPPDESAESEPETERGQLGEDVPLPEVISYEGELTAEVFDELWEISVRWEVGDNRIIVPQARQRLIDFGPDILPFLSLKFDNMYSGLAIRAFDVILAEMLELDREGTIAILVENLESDEDMRRRIALAEIATLKVIETEDMVAGMLNDPEPGFQRRAIGVLGALESHAADERLIENLSVVDDEALIKVSMEVLFGLEVSCWDELRPLLDHPYISVRETLIGLLASHYDMYADDISREFGYVLEPDSGPAGHDPLSIRALRSLMKVMTTTDNFPDYIVVNAVFELLMHEDWGVRGDAVGLVVHWHDMSQFAPTEDMTDEDMPLYDPAVVMTMIETHLDYISLMELSETEPYVLFKIDELNAEQYRE